MDRRKFLKKQYRETERDMGVYRIRNTANNKSLVECSRDLKAALNRHRAELGMGTHLNKALQADWNASAPDSFVFEYLEVLKPLDTPGYDPAEDLEELLGLWRAKLLPQSDCTYGDS
jgi:hypothetical protein